MDDGDGDSENDKCQSTIELHKIYVGVIKYLNPHPTKLFL